MLDIYKNTTNKVEKRMNNVPFNGLLGRLKLTTLFEFVDIPLLFLCEDTKDNTYLCNAVDEIGDTIIWTYIPISNDTVIQLKSSKIDFRTASLSAIDKTVFKVTTNEKFEEIETVEIKITDIPEEWLPHENEFL